MKLNDRVAAVGVGYSQTGRRLGLTSWQLAIQAAKAAMADAGLGPEDIDGISLLWGVAGPAPAGLDTVDPMDLGYMLGIKGLNWYGTAGPSYIGPAIQAVTAIRAGMAHTVLTLRIIRQRLSSDEELARSADQGPTPRRWRRAVHGTVRLGIARVLHRRPSGPTAHGSVRHDRGAIRCSRGGPAVPRVAQRRRDLS